MRPANYDGAAGVSHIGRTGGVPTMSRPRGLGFGAWGLAFPTRLAGSPYQSLCENPLNSGRDEVRLHTQIGEADQGARGVICYPLPMAQFEPRLLAIISHPARDSRYVHRLASIL